MCDSFHQFFQVRCASYSVVYACHRWWEEHELLCYLLRHRRQPGTILWTTCLSEPINQKSVSAPALTDFLPAQPLQVVVVYSLLAAAKAVQPLRFPKKLDNTAFYEGYVLTYASQTTATLQAGV
jgi:hypothetical protein